MSSPIRFISYAFVSTFTSSRVLRSLNANTEPSTSYSRSTYRTSPVRCALPHPRSLITDGQWLAQTARLAMAAFQLSSYFTTALLQPVYLPSIFTSLTASDFSLLRAQGFANLLLFHNVRQAKSQDKHYANIVSLSSIALLATLLPIKPLSVNLFYVSSLLFAALINVYNLLNSSSLSAQAEPAAPGQSGCTISSFVTAAKFVLGLCTCFVPFFTPQGLLQRTYLLQVAIHLMISAVLGFRNPSCATSPVDAFLWLGVAVSIAPKNSPLAGFMAVSAISALLLRLGETVRKRV